MQSREQILHLLADGRFHSGEAIAEAIGCSRSAVWKQVQALRQETGLQVDAVTGRGYRLSCPLELLDETQIRQSLDQTAIRELDICSVLGSVGSTNALAGDRRLSGTRPAAAWFAEHQSAGRCRRGRPWDSPYGRNLYFSLAYRFDLPLGRVAGLSLAAGAVLATTLARHGLRDHGLKWPNDLLWNSRKLAGILLEAQGETDGPTQAVIGIGLNIDLDREASERIDQPAVCLREAGLRPGRNRLAGDLLGALLQMCRTYQQQGLQPFLQQWRDFDVFRGRSVRLLGPGSEVRGESLGIADDGGLQLRIDGGIRTFYGGELSLRGDHTP